jgi:hypothetical protein
VSYSASCVPKLAWRASPVALLIFFPAVLLILAGCGPRPASVQDSPSTNQPSQAVSAMNPQFRPLLGKWLRTDSPYTIEITAIDGEGKVSAAYFNPGPINVSRALAFTAEVKVRVAIELRDTGYPGCIYDLTYNASTDQLTGTYFQAAMGETYQIAFQRERQ